jgi:hypothetical protein
MVAFITLAISVFQLNAQEINYKTYSVFVYNFMKYIEWPSTSNSSDQFIIYVLGNSKIKTELDQLAKSKKIKGKNIIIKSAQDVQEFSDANLIYLSENKSSTIKEVQNKLKNKNVLLVGEREDMARKGAAISFVVMEETDELSFDINLKELSDKKLQISNSLLKLGNVVAE